MRARRFTKEKGKRKGGADSLDVSLHMPLSHT